MQDEFGSLTRTVKAVLRTTALYDPVRWSVVRVYSDAPISVQIHRNEKLSQATSYFESQATSYFEVIFAQDQFGCAR